MSLKYQSTTALDPRIIAYIQAWLGSTKIFIISKIRCKLCRRAKTLLREVAGSSITPVIVEIDKYPHRWTNVFLKYLSAQSKVRTVPLIWIHGKFIGGFEDILRLHKEGRLVYLFKMKTLDLRKFKKNRISTTYIPTKRKPSMRTKVPLELSTVKQPVEKTPIIVRIRTKNSGMVNTGNKVANKGYRGRRNSVSYRPLTFSVDDESNKPMRNSKTLSRPRAQSMGNIYNSRKSSCSRGRSRRWRVLLPAQITGSAKAKEAMISKDRATRDKLLITRISGAEEKQDGWI